MSKFKYKMIIKGSRENISKFSVDLVKIGYSTSQAFNTDGSVTVPSDRFCLGINNYSDVGIALIIDERGRKSDYKFNVDTHWEYKAALAIASIREGDTRLYTGEWVKCIKHDAGLKIGQYYELSLIHI